MAFRLDVTVATKNSLWPLATIVEDLDLLGGVVGPLGEPLHVLGGDLVPGHRHHLGSPRVRAEVGITDNQFTLSCQVLCLTHSWNTPSYVLVVSEFNVSHSVLLSRYYGLHWVEEPEEMLWQVCLLEIACRIAGDSYTTNISKSIYALDTASSDIAMAWSNVVCSRYQEMDHKQIIFSQFLV